MRVSFTLLRSSLDRRWIPGGYWRSLLDVAFVVGKYCGEMHDFKRNMKRALVQPTSKHAVLKLALEPPGAGLVAIGVAGELYIEASIGAVEAKI